MKKLSMRTKLLFTPLLFLIFQPFAPSILNAQGWVQKADFVGIERHFGVGFSIGNKGYVGTGGVYIVNAWNMKRDFWEWDQVSNVWTQKADFGGVARFSATGFSIGTKGYIGTGSGGTTGTFFYNDFWEWNQATNVWIRKADFGGGARQRAEGFSIGAKGYIGTGYSSGPSTFYSDFWEWDQLTDTWTQKANFAGCARHSAVAFSIGTKGYIGTGYCSGVQDQQDLWEWDQANNSWTQMANFPGTARRGAVGFSIGTKGYIGTGFSNASQDQQDFWEWDQSSNSWTAIPAFGGTARNGAFGFAVGTNMYVGGGYSNSTSSYAKDFWEFNPNCVLHIVPSYTTVIIGASVPLSGSYSPSSSNVVYNWSPVAGLSNSTIANPIATPSITTTYVLVAEDTITHCTNTDNVTIKVNTPGNKDDVAYSVASDNSGNYFVTGSFRSAAIVIGGSTTLTNASADTSDIFIAKYNSSGSLLWAKDVGGSLNDNSYSAATDASGNCYIVGSFESQSLAFGSVTITNPAYNPVNYRTAMFIAKYDPSGNVLWAKTPSGGVYYDYSYSVATDASGNVFMSGHLNGGSVSFGSVTLSCTNNSIFLVKFNSSGTAQWGFTTDATDANNGYSHTPCVVTDPSGNVYLAGGFKNIDTYPFTAAIYICGSLLINSDPPREAPLPMC